MNRGDGLLYTLQGSFERVRSAKGLYSAQKFKKHNAKRIDIGASVNGAAQYTFWGGIFGTSQQGTVRIKKAGRSLRILCMSLYLKHRSQPKTGYLYVKLFAYEHI